MRQIITNYIRAGYAGVYLVSPEEQRVCAELKAIAKEIGFRLYSWSTTDGIIDTETGKNGQASDPMEALLAVADLPENSVLVLRDFHLFLADPNPILLRQFKDVVQICKAKSKALIILGCRLCLPPELEREITIVEFALPGKAELGMVLDGILCSAQLQASSEQEREAALEAARGMTTIEAENAFALSVVEAKAVIPSIVAREKANEVRKNGLLEIIEAKESLDDVGGLGLLKDWLLERKNTFSREAEAYRLPISKGLLILGLPGTGKSLTAKATAGVFQRPLLRLDAGRLFGSLVGQSESNLRSAIKTAEAVAPCVLWIDEIEKGFSGGKSSAATDGGTSARVLGSLLNWMAEKRTSVFVIATANGVTELPPELLRKGRFDEIFFVDLPTQDEREAIWRIHIRKYGRAPENFDCAQLAKATEGFTGAEIEQAFVEALYNSFGRKEEPTELVIGIVLSRTVPLSVMMRDHISALRQWAKGRTRRAAPASEENTARRIASY